MIPLAMEPVALKLLKKDHVAKCKLAELDLTLPKEELEAKHRRIIGDLHNLKNNPKNRGANTGWRQSTSPVTRQHESNKVLRAIVDFVGSGVVTYFSSQNNIDKNHLTNWFKVDGVD
ncbi:hypothetical protein BC830DRAFT_1215431 [Chytriomyces sp. MP71]|nr:hypothetical protein BC830DRAFT_1215431 [Chytriomyces sp. MP71]